MAGLRKANRSGEDKRFDPTLSALSTHFFFFFVAANLRPSPAARARAGRRFQTDGGGYLGNVPESQRLHEAELRRKPGSLGVVPISLGAGLLPGRVVQVGGALVELQGRVQREGLVAALADEAVKVADATPEVGLAPHLRPTPDTDTAQPPKGSPAFRKTTATAGN